MLEFKQGALRPVERGNHDDALIERKILEAEIRPRAHIPHDDDEYRRPTRLSAIAWRVTLVPNSSPGPTYQALT
ncbi:MAG: hypothetical protein ACK5RC_08835 [Curvibacter sp.]|nr:hypothetical protein [Curvibacter sp.]